MGGGPRYTEAELRRAYDATPPAGTGALFWHLVGAELGGRSGRGVYSHAQQRLGWAPKVLKPKPCHMCGKRCAWDEFADGGRIRVCRSCATDVLGGRR